MLITRERDGERIGFVVRDVPPEYVQGAGDLGFGELGDEGGAFVRWFPADAEGGDEAFARFVGAFEPMVRQAARLEAAPWDGALRRFLEIVDGSGIAWWLGGSGALAVRGIEVVPRDLDLVTDRDGAQGLGRLLRPYLVEPSVPMDGWIGEWWGRAFLGARIEWVGGVRPGVDESEPTDFGPVAGGQLETVEWGGYPVRVPPVALARAVTVRRGLGERVRAIDEWLRARS